MEPGFAGVDDASLKVSKSERVYLWRIPKDLNLGSFDGLELDLNSSVVGSVKDSYGHEFKIEVDKTGVYNDRVRPVIYDQLVDSGRITRSFDNTYNITMKFDTTPIDISSQVTRFTYPVVPQLDFLTVRTIPRGSSTTLEELRKRQAEAAAMLAGEVKPSKKQKKEKHSHKEESSSKSKKSEPVVAPVVEVVEVESEEKKKKKKKKDKSNKD